MSAFFQLPSIFPSVNRPRSSDKLGTPQSRDGILQSVFRAIRHPSSVVERIVEDSIFQSATPEPTAEEARESKAKLLQLALKEAASLDQWKSTAEELDKVEGANVWKRATESPEYNYTLVESRLRDLDDARRARDVQRMLFLIRTALTRNLGGMGSIQLYRHAHVGTKHLIERYIGSTLETLDSLLEHAHHKDDDELGPRYLLEQILAARQSFGRSALLLSGGGTLGMSHIGVVKALWDARLLPRIVSGASAGSIVCAVLCTRKDEELPKTLEEFCYGDLSVFTRAGEDDGILYQISRLLKDGALFDIAHLSRVMRNLVGDMTFQEAYNRTRRILNICVSSASIHELPRLLNYVTAPNVMIWSAVAASCSVPVVFTAASLLAKDPKTGEAIPWDASPQRWIDGSVDNDLPMQRLAELFNVNHFIVSQVNPHVTPFIAREEQSVRFTGDSPASSSTRAFTLFQTLGTLARDEAMHRIQILSELGFFPNLLTKATSILSQRYSGDITIFPSIPYSHFPKVLTNPTTNFMLESALCGERATWPELSRIQNHCAIELALDDVVQKLRARIAFSPSQVNLRLYTRQKRQARANTSGAELKGRRRRSQRHLKVDTSERQPTRANSSRTISNHAPLARPLSITLPVDDFASAFGPTSGKFEFNNDGMYQEGESSSSSASPPTPDRTDRADYFTLKNSQGSSQGMSPWYPTRKLFPYSSQPSTPLRPVASQSPSASTALKSALPVSTKTRSSELTMTAISQSKGQRPNVAARVAAWQQASDADAAAGNFHNHAPPPSDLFDGYSYPLTGKGIEPDPSGTRGMMLRKKRSASTPKSPAPGPSINTDPNL